MTTERERARAAITLCRAVFGLSNLIGTDLEDVEVSETGREFVQGKGGLHIQFSVSWHALGKVGKDLSQALEVLGVELDG